MNRFTLSHSKTSLEFGKKKRKISCFEASTFGNTVADKWPSRKKQISEQKQIEEAIEHSAEEGDR